MRRPAKSPVFRVNTRDRCDIRNGHGTGSVLILVKNWTSHIWPRAIADLRLPAGVSHSRPAIWIYDSWGTCVEHSERHEAF